MQYNEYDHRNAKCILESKGILSEIRTLISSISFSEETQLHSAIIKHFSVNKGWIKNHIVHPAISSRFRDEKYDLFHRVYKIAVEVEFTRYELLFRDFMRILRGINSGEIEVGIIIMLDSDEDVKQVAKSVSVAPTLALCEHYLKYFYSEISAPIYVIGLKLL